MIRIRNCGYKIIAAIGIAGFIACSHKTTPATTTGENGNDTIIARSINQFAFELFRTVAENNGNTVLSPYSISVALAMTYGGAASETEKQMREVMHYGNNDEAFHAAYSQLIKDIGALDGDGIELITANALWAQKDYEFKKAYFKNTGKYYGAGLQYADFRQEVEKARIAINAWVEKETKNKINNLLVPGVLNDLTRLVLVNAIYFNGKWDKPFDPKKTTAMDFWFDTETGTRANFMVTEEKFNYLGNEELEMLEMPYAGGKASMLLVLPVKKDGLDALLAGFDITKVENLSLQMRAEKVRLFLPKFNTTAEFELSEALQKLGMKDPFTNDADFSLMTGKRDLQIDKVIHKAFVGVDEAGTEAAAATAVVIREKSAQISISEFRADHPFLFLIRDKTTGTILFMGCIRDPNK